MFISGSSAIDDHSDALDALTCLAANDFSSMKRSLSSDAFVPKNISEDQETNTANLSMVNPNSDDPR